MSANNKLTLQHSLCLNNTLGEGVVWEHRLQRLYWTDILQNKLYCWSFDGQLNVYVCPDKLCSFGLTTDPQWLICAFSSGFAFFKPTTQDIRWVTQLSMAQGERLNDGRVDRQGRFWAGTMADKAEQGALYRLDFNGTVDTQINNVNISNSLCWSPTGERVYFADSPTRRIQTAVFEPTSGNIGPLQDFVNTEKDAYPDGACVDAQGCLWSAQWGSSSVKRYSPDGQLLFTLTVPCKQPSCVSFAGPKLDQLCVTSARQHLKDENINQYDGGLFIYKTPYTGLPEEICKMPIPVTQ